MNAQCPECKNDISFEQKTPVTGDILECEMCGITLSVMNIADENVELDIVDEGK